MSTRSAIIAKIGDKYHGVCCHSDGYLEGVGATLLAHYIDPAKVVQLVALGNLSLLGEEIGEKHGFDENRYDDSPRARQIGKWCRAYRRDRGEELTVARDVAWRSVASAIGHDGFVYVFENGTWSVARESRSGPKFSFELGGLEPLAEAISKPKAA